MKIKYLANKRRSKYYSNDILQCIITDISKSYNVSITNEEIFEGYAISKKIAIGNCDGKIADIGLFENEYSGHSFFRIEIETHSLINQDLIFLLKSDLLGVLKQYYKATIVQQDDQTRELCKLLYDKIHDVENRMRNIVNTVMTYHYGLNWYDENIQGEEFRRVLNPNNDWYSKKYLSDLSIRKTVYSLYFKQIVGILVHNTNDSINNELYNKIMKLKKDTDSIDTEIIKCIDKPKSYWDEHFSSLFNIDFLTQWEDLNNRRNVIAHNKLLVKDFYEDTQRLLDERQNELIEVQEKINKEFDERYINFIQSVLHEEALEAELWEDYQDSIYEQVGLSRFDEDSAQDFIAQSNDFTNFSRSINTYFEYFDSITKDMLNNIELELESFDRKSFKEKKKVYSQMTKMLNSVFGKSLEFDKYKNESELDICFGNLIEYFDEIISDFEDSRSTEYIMDFVNDKSICYYDIFGNEINIAIEYDFYYEAGGENTYPILLVHKYSDHFFEFFNKLDQSKYLMDDYPFKSVLKFKENSIVARGSIQLTFGDYSIVDSTFYPESCDGVAISEFTIQDYLEDYKRYLNHRLNV
ncbi:hypothetical protein [Tepidibacter hydrothermalis]|uniref:Apea-like HEPN domain-containing protein n=1 Tax=Tepidibacter hydrothermalis TaxID=3036126 RepID=A0ABY8EEW7_9FIRM|nr:hypothetical protein [Tepidibacter hydrothermalis]WFD11326.1 hypothetical protein P4S50_04410 [Tepidibacter hydrothermalis]